MDSERVRPALAPTGDPRVDAAIGGLASLEDVDLAERPAVLEAVHDRLREILGELGDPGRPGRRPGARASPAGAASRASWAVPFSLGASSPGRDSTSRHRRGPGFQAPVPGPGGLMPEATDQPRRARVAVCCRARRSRDPCTGARGASSVAEGRRP